MPLVTVKLLKGRTLEQKRRLNHEIVKAFDTVMGVPGEAVWTLFEEVDAEEWFVAEESLADRKRAKEQR